MKGATAAMVATLVSIVACDDMADQPKVLPYETYRGETPDFAPALPPPGTIPTNWMPAPKPPPVTAALLARGQERFNIFCAPCHGPTGDGNGMVVERGFPAPPSYHIDRLRQAPVQHFYDVITNGYGVMFSYADRVPPNDRWAIAAYIRALQASQNTPVASLTPDEQKALP
jgi:mono/diheme cytochrome c family protein